MIPVTKPYLPSQQKLKDYIDSIYERQWLTNNGVLVQELTQRLEAYLGVENLLLVSNGTLALQVAYRSLDIAESNRAATPEAITTPFTFIATASSLKWEGVQPIFADIDSNTWCIDPEKIEAAITPNSRAIVPVHVFGNACDVEAIDRVAARHKLKIVYDASHAFGVRFRNQSLLNYGDASTLSFHATKLFHTIEGGAIVFKRKEDHQRATKLINFGITGPDSIGELGINAKMNEFQAAMGLCVLDEIESNVTARSLVSRHYDKHLPLCVERQQWNMEANSNHAYLPVVFESQAQALAVLHRLSEAGVTARRYFYPSLDQAELEMGTGQTMPVSRDIASRILCLPIYAALKPAELSLITDLVKEVVAS
ncbi:DegT/DnrJ/EryC1/StrS family aminotransferase [Hydrocarboniclastica marina]|uniref:DegT/DnrJ/EryC1/StrS family aminotransferase n=1 Tax=Hydrocarboniclastica marina TaxID=2259620 RepID=A0A4V1D8V1_9ALTE|nr:DegT/DnrJ/EryC1/StrS family aminotransferase [Hydrocarboniclastica marina]QCF26470.1 DegT/DnrJ/EryC1/StrS family aminotransferase [Hydrocarboniclastica marina]